MLNVDFSEHRLRQIGFWMFSPKDFAQPEQQGLFKARDMAAPANTDRQRKMTSKPNAINVLDRVASHFVQRMLAEKLPNQLERSCLMPPTY